MTGFHEAIHILVLTFRASSRSVSAKVLVRVKVDLLGLIYRKGSS
jgi:hypothetical protein